MKQLISSFLHASLLIVLPGCYIPSRYIIRRNVYIPPKKELYTPAAAQRRPMTTIWIHGTRLFRAQNQHGIKGIIPAQEVHTECRLRSIADTLVMHDPQRFCLQDLYLFGWSGKLCFQEREASAYELYCSLKALVKEHMQATNERPALRIIAHSHGGNVALKIASFVQPEDNILIDELILMAVPVQEETKKLLKHPMFKQIYVLYSSLDLIQILDPQGMYKHSKKSPSFFSKRQFMHQKNLAQMKIKINQRAIMHTEFSHPQFLRLLPRILDDIDRWQQEITYRKDPNKMSRLLCVYTNRTRKPPTI